MSTRRWVAIGGALVLAAVLRTEGVSGRVTGDASTGCGETRPDELIDSDLPLYVDATHIWKGSIPVCFENPSDTTEVIRTTIQNAAETVWAGSGAKIEFTGWGTCNAKSKGIRILFADDNPHVSALGSGLDGKKNGMYLNPFYSTVKTSCDDDNPFVGPDGRSWSSKRTYCVYVHTVHEFGHALGFSHEQNRPDTPALAPTPETDCADQAQGSNGTATVGTWDPYSVMVQSYCGVKSLGRLSPVDIAGAQTYYGQKSADFLWWVEGNMQEIMGDYTLATRIAVTNANTKIAGHYSAFTGDFDGDGLGDIFWYRPGAGEGHTDKIWWGQNGRGFTAQEDVVDVSGTYTPIPGDFDGDGYDDVLWYLPGAGIDYLWWSNGNRTFSSVPTKVDGYYTPTAGDFDGDGKTDIHWYRPGGGTANRDNMWWGSANRAFVHEDNVHSVVGTFKPFAGDFDGDGDVDIFWYAPGAVDDYQWWSNGNRTFTKVSNVKVEGTYQVAVGDFDGNGTADIFWNDPSSVTDHVWLWRKGQKSYVDTPSSLLGSYIPLTADFDGDGKTDIFWYGG